MLRFLILIFGTASALYPQAAAPAYATIKEAALGNQALLELARTWKSVDTPAFVEIIAGKLAFLAQRPMAVKVFQSDEALANNLPGGIMYVTTGLIEAAGSDELMAILAHQAAHVSLLHGGPVPNGFGVAVIYMGARTGICTRMAEAGTLFIPKALEQRFGAQEAAADTLAAEYLRKAASSK